MVLKPGLIGAMPVSSTTSKWYVRMFSAIELTSLPSPLSVSTTRVIYLPVICLPLAAIRDHAWLRVLRVPGMNNLIRIPINDAFFETSL